MVELHVERTIAASGERVFDWLADPVNMAAAPAILKSGWTKGSRPGLGAFRDVVGAGTWIREEITAYDPPHAYSYRIVRSFPAFGHEGGSLTLTPAAAGTHVDWVTAYRHPAWVGGAALGTVTAPLLRSSFEAILAACAKALET